MIARRVLVIRRRAAGGRPRLSADPEAPDDAPDVRGLMAAQLRRALATTGVALALLAVVAVAVPRLPGPAAWAVLSLAAQPVLLALAAGQLRRAERLER